MMLRCILYMRRFLWSTYSGGRLTTGCPQRGIACIHNYQRPLVSSGVRVPYAWQVCSSFRFGAGISPSAHAGRVPWVPLLSALPVSKLNEMLLGGHLKIQYKKERPLKWVCGMHGEQGDASKQNTLPRLPCVHIIRIRSSQRTQYACKFCNKSPSKSYTICVVANHR
jgi:hypothetical protein